MIKNMICIECPKGCALSLEMEADKIKTILGAKCPKGTAYAVAETENPVRIFTSTVMTEGLGIKLAPVRTDGPIPKRDIMKAATEVRRLKISKPVVVGDIIIRNFIGLGVNLVVTREIPA